MFQLAGIRKPAELRSLYDQCASTVPQPPGPSDGAVSEPEHDDSDREDDEVDEDLDGAAETGNETVHPSAGPPVESARQARIAARAAVAAKRKRSPIQVCPDIPSADDRTLQ